MPDINLPSLKEQLWQKMQGELANSFPMSLNTTD
jgi:hypothetical protein